MKQILALLILIVGVSFFLHRKKNPVPHEELPSIPVKEEETQIEEPVATQVSEPLREESSHVVTSAPARTQTAVALSKKADGPRRTKNGIALPYVLEDGLVVVQGDLVVGVPLSENPDESGYVEVPTLHLWPGNIIPYHIDAGLKNPDRIHQALALFEGTAVHFVPYTNQKDALVFVDGNGTCKSYVGKIGGHQPVWLPQDCGPREIAHELMHALGFVHEQNRNDRDDFVQVLYENIDEKYKDNFEKLPADFMKANGLANFDYESLMIYPVWMFAKDGRNTMQPKIRDQQILPSQGLSKSDIERINHLYGTPGSSAN